MSHTKSCPCHVDKDLCTCSKNQKRKSSLGPSAATAVGTRHRRASNTSVGSATSNSPKRASQTTAVGSSPVPPDSFVAMSFMSPNPSGHMSKSPSVGPTDTTAVDPAIVLRATLSNGSGGISENSASDANANPYQVFDQGSDFFRSLNSSGLQDESPHGTVDEGPLSSNLTDQMFTPSSNDEDMLFTGMYPSPFSNNIYEPLVSSMQQPLASHTSNVSPVPFQPHLATQQSSLKSLASPPPDTNAPVFQPGALPPASSNDRRNSPLFAMPSVSDRKPYDTSSVGGSSPVPFHTLMNNSNNQHQQKQPNVSSASYLAAPSTPSSSSSPQTSSGGYRSHRSSLGHLPVGAGINYPGLSFSGPFYLVSSNQIHGGMDMADGMSNDVDDPVVGLSPKFRSGRILNQPTFEQSDVVPMTAAPNWKKFFNDTT